ncbi:MAG: methyltransferase domain-containing protein [Actinomycetota bacterium]|nr:methyltransferase domain-containing protein [Actinomycetota bacterium]
MADDRRHLRQTFDSAAENYQQARPEYPEELYDMLIETAGLRVGDRLLEIGCATGKATIPLARQGFQIIGIEIGPRLVAAARHNLAAFPLVTIIEADFESWRPPNDLPFDLVFAATSWHWIDPAVRYRTAWELLRPAGHLAFWSATHVFPNGGDPFFAQIQDVYDEIGKGKPANPIRPRPGELPDQADEIRRSGLFDDIQVRHLDWEISYPADEYIALLDTFSGHIAMPAPKREQLYTEIRHRLATRPDSRVRRGWGAVLHVARRIG